MAKDKQVAEKGAAMIPDTLGPCPPQRPAKHMFVGYEEWACVSTDYADWQRRRAERAEELLQKSRRWRDHDPRCSDHPGDKCLCGLLEYQARVAAHFAEVKP